MGFLSTIVEYEGVLVDVRPRYWAAHQQGLAAVGLNGPDPEEFWRLIRTGASDGLLAPMARTTQMLEYAKARDQARNDTDLFALDEAHENLEPSLRVLKAMGTCHLASLSPNRDALNAVLNRLNLWMYFDRKAVLPVDRERRVKAITEMAGSGRSLAVAGSVPFAYAASEAGCRVVGLTTGVAFPKQMRQVGVDLFYESLDALTDALSRHDPELQRIGVI